MRRALHGKVETGLALLSFARVAIFAILRAIGGQRLDEDSGLAGRAARYPARA